LRALRSQAGRIHRVERDVVSVRQLDEILKIRLESRVHAEGIGEIEHRLMTVERRHVPDHANQAKERDLCLRCVVHRQLL
jgi:hypothetical protein